MNSGTTKQPTLTKISMDAFGRDLYEMQGFGTIDMAATALEAAVQDTGVPAALLWNGIPTTFFPGMTRPEWYHAHGNARGAHRAEKAGI